MRELDLWLLHKMHYVSDEERRAELKRASQESEEENQEECAFNEGLDLPGPCSSRVPRKVRRRALDNLLPSLSLSFSYALLSLEK